jgi:hypothetical protein
MAELGVSIQEAVQGRGLRGQTPKDEPGAVSAQVGTCVQHALRASTPEETKALRATVTTFPKSDFSGLEQLLTQLGIGEAALKERL